MFEKESNEGELFLADNKMNNKAITGQLYHQIVVDSYIYSYITRTDQMQKGLKI